MWALFREAFERLAHDSYEFGDLLRKLVPEFHVYLVRLCDGGHPLPRARALLALDGLVPDAQHVPELSQLLRRVVRLDLFVPPQRERIREKAARFAATGLVPGEIVRQITADGKEKPSATAVQKALALDAKMKSLGLASPYLLLTEPPADYPKLRRHLNNKYQFQRRDGYEPPPLPPR